MRNKPSQVATQHCYSNVISTRSLLILPHLISFPVLVPKIYRCINGFRLFNSKCCISDEMQSFFDPKADVVPLVLAVLIVSVNSLVLVLMSRKRNLRSNTNLLLGSLALSDLLTGLVSVPLFLTCNIVRQSAICVTEEQMSRFISASIICHLMSVTVDR